MSLEEVKAKFIVDEGIHTSKLERLIQTISGFCVVDKQGRVHLSHNTLSTTETVKLVLVARYLAAELEPQIKSEMTVNEVESSAGIEPKQVGARLSELVSAKFATIVRRGVYRAVPHRIESFVESLSKKRTT